MKKLMQFLTESRAELKKVVWPKKDEVVKSTWIVVIFMAAVAAFLFGADKGIQYLNGILWGNPG